VLEIKDGKVIDFQGTYEEYLASQGVQMPTRKVG
jgi:hypothetical protein